MAPSGRPPEEPTLRDLVQEVKELGLKGTAFRLGWELKVRSGVAGRLGPTPPRLDRLLWPRPEIPLEWTRCLPFADAASVGNALRGLLPPQAPEDLRREAEQAARGLVRCFGRWEGDFGDPIDWQRNPVTRVRWPSWCLWTEALSDEGRVGDIKLTWEVGRFPHAYTMARATAFDGALIDRLAPKLLAQMESFSQENAFARSVHWASGQEIVFRLMAWLFALDVLLSRGPWARRAQILVGDALLAGVAHLERHIDYARLAVYNNHLLSEALGLYMAGALLPESSVAHRWGTMGRRLLEEEAERQFYRDGAYIQQSHNYHRVALQDLLWACAFARAAGDAPAESWLRALERSVDFLVAQQNGVDGRLPNSGANDGALPAVLSTCDFTDFRPTLQAASLVSRGERLYEPGPWDEEAAWLLGPHRLDAPLRRLDRRAVSFAATGYHVLRGRSPETFGTFRCGTLRDRFSQIDMLHLDVWWRGLNVLVDGGSYLYNGPAEWHEHFLGTASHNTVTIDGRDQMLHHRRFKVLYWTKARLLRFHDTEAWSMVAGEHYGYGRHSGRCVHRRSVLLVKDDLWVIADQVTGSGRHAVRLHWLGGDFPFTASPERGSLALMTPKGEFGVTVWNTNGEPAAATVVAGQESPPRGWLSRYYGEKVAVPSLAVELGGDCPVTLVSVLGTGQPQLRSLDGRFEAHADGARVGFRLEGGLFESISL